MSRLLWLIVIVVFACSSNPPQAGSDLTEDQIRFLQNLGILQGDESIIVFDSQSSFKVSGNFVSDMRVASYWIDKRDSTKNSIEWAFYKDVKSVDSVFTVSPTFAPYLLITRENGSKFKVYFEGNDVLLQSIFKEVNLRLE